MIINKELLQIFFYFYQKLMNELRAPKKKQSSGGELQSDDIINIFKERKDPVIILTSSK